MSSTISKQDALILSGEELPVSHEFSTTISGEQLFPEDQWEDVAPLGGEDSEGNGRAKRQLAQEHTPFYILAAMERPSQYQDGGTFWLTIIQIDQSLFAMAMSKQDRNYDRLQLVHDALEQGYTQAGPFELRLVPTDKGNPFYKLVTHRDNITN